jgi:hypothetical protein
MLPRWHAPATTGAWPAPPWTAARFRIGEVMGVDSMIPPLEDDCERMANFVGAPWYERWWLRSRHFWAIALGSAKLWWGMLTA